LATIRNWRDGQPEVAHMSVIRWGGLRPKSFKKGDEGARVLERLAGFARHALQGRKTSDHHKHQNTEQVYYVLSGSGEVLVGDERHSVTTGDAVYLPANAYHQMFNDDNEDWLEHLVIGAKIDGNDGDFKNINWKQVNPVDSGGAVQWRQLGPEKDGNIGCLQGLQSITRASVQPDSETAQQNEKDLEQIIYILENQGILISEGHEEKITEGDMIHVPPEMVYQIQNPFESWFTYLIIAG